MHLSQKKLETATLLFFVCLIIFFLGQELLPFSNGMFEFHDQTQPARIQQFILNLKYLQFPPRLAPDFSFKLGYPVFNFYAPFSYWITGFISFFGFGIIQSLKLSFLLLVIMSFLSALFYFKNHFRFFPSIFGAVIYSSSLYLAVDIFIRGNLGEAWFIALVPAAFALLEKNATASKKKIFLMNIFVLTAILSVHNILSLLFIPLAFIYIFLLKHKKANVTALIFAFLLNSYYFLPLLIESSLTYAKDVAQLTNYKEHFLCIGQLWNSLTWGYGGSIAGCDDGMPFKLGKPQVIFSLLGVCLFLFYSFIRKNHKLSKISVFFIFLTVFSLFLTTYQSEFLWNIFSQYSSVIQFPWRFISLSLIGLAYFSAFFWDRLPIPWNKIFITFISIIVLFSHSKYFTKPQISQKAYSDKYLSTVFIEQQAAYSIAEYLPKTADYNYWRDYGTKFSKGLKEYKPVIAEVKMPENSNIEYSSPFKKIILIKNQSTIKLNIHYFPFWKIVVNNQTVVPKTFDELGRPTIDLNQKENRILLEYSQTNWEKIANILTILTIILIILTLRTNVWNTLSKKKI